MSEQRLALELDDDGYPTENSLKAIKDWLPRMESYLADLHEVFPHIRSIWRYADCGYWTIKDCQNELDHKGTRHFVSTGGWSGNEDLIRAMRANSWIWNCWEEHRRGGHYTFFLDDPDDYARRIAEQDARLSELAKESEVDQ